MVARGTEIRAEWRRFSDYQIKEVHLPKNVPSRFADHYRYIRAAPNARLEAYSLIIGHGEDEGDGHEFAAYEDIRDIDLEDENAILGWCQRYGLLGILPERVVSIHLASRWRQFFDVSDPHLFPTQTSYSRTSVGWQQVTKSTLKGDNSKIIKLDEKDRKENWLGQLVSSEDTTHVTPNAIISRLFTTEYEEKRLGEAIGQYFPDVPYGERDTAEYPLPLSEAFWSQYGESLSEFRNAVHQFREMVGKLTNQGPPQYLPEEARSNLHQGRTALNSLASASQELVIDKDGSFAPRWAFSSLLGVFAFSVWQDLIGGKPARHCNRPRCRKVFLASNTKRQYCSDRCKQAEEKARQRKRRSPAG